MSPEERQGPVTPSEAAEMRITDEAVVPEEVFTAFNHLIAQNLRNGRAKVLQKDVEAQLVAQGLTVDEIYDRNLLGVSDSYREKGWRVKYERPVYYGGEDFDAYYEFVDPNKHPNR